MRSKKLCFSDYSRPNESIAVTGEVVRGYHTSHTHEDFIEIAFIDKGQGFQRINGRSFPIRAGDLFLFNPNVEHDYTSHDTDPLTVINCIFQPAMIGLGDDTCRDFLDVAYRFLYHTLEGPGETQEYLRLTPADTGAIRSLLAEMREEYEARQGGFMQILKADLTKLLIHIFRLYRAEEGMESNRVYRKLIVEEAITYLREHLAEPVSCDALAHRAYLSVNHFRHVFKAVTGEPIVVYRQRMRVQEACRLLAGTDLPVSAVAEAVGYGDVKFFGEIFRKETGLAPARWRRQEGRKLLDNLTE